MHDSHLALYGKFKGGRCLTHVGREGRAEIQAVRILLGGHAPVIEIGLPIEILLLLFQVRFVIKDLAGSLVEPRLEIGRIDLKKQIPLFHLLVIMDRNMNNRA